MPRRLMLVLMIALLAAFACSFVVYKLVGGRLIANQAKTNRVVIAATDIKLGSVLRAQDLQTTDTQGTIPKDAILKMDDAVGRGVISNIYQGEPIMNERLAAPGSGGGLAATIKLGMRAIAVKVDEVIGVAGFVTPGMRVDVLVSGNPPEQTKVNQDLGTQVRTLLQNVEVLSAGQDIQKDAEGKPVPVQVVSLLVTPADAELLTLAASQTKIQLVLRNPLDTQVSKPQGSAMANIFAGMDLRPKTNIVSGPRKPVSQAPQPFVVEVFNGTARTEQKFSSKESKQ